MNSTLILFAPKLTSSCIRVVFHNPLQIFLSRNAYVSLYVPWYQHHSCLISSLSWGIRKQCSCNRINGSAIPKLLPAWDERKLVCILMMVHWTWKKHCKTGFCVMDDTIGRDETLDTMESSCCLWQHHRHLELWIWWLCSSNVKVTGKRSEHLKHIATTSVIKKLLPATFRKCHCPNASLDNEASQCWVASCWKQD